MIAGSHQGVARENKAKLYDSELPSLPRRRGWGGKVRQMCQHSEGTRREIRCTVISLMNLYESEGWPGQWHVNIHAERNTHVRM